MTPKWLWTIAKQKNWKTEERCPGRNAILSENTRVMPEDNFPSGWLMEDTEGNAEEVKNMRKRSKEEEEDVKSQKGTPREGKDRERS